MTNFNTATRSFDLCAEGTQSYAWAWEGLDRVQCLSEIEHTNNDIVAYAHGWACELCHNCIAQIDPEGERGFTAEEITNDLIDDRHSLARALEAWLGDNDDSDDDNEEGEETSDEAYLGESTLSKIRRQKGLLLDDDRPEVAEKAVTPIAPDGTEHTQPRQGFFIATSSVEGRGGTPIGMIWAFSDEADFYRQNPHWVGVELPNPRWYGVIVKDTTLYIDGGFQLAWGGWHDCVIYSPHIYRP